MRYSDLSSEEKMYAAMLGEFMQPACFQLEVLLKLVEVIGAKGYDADSLYELAAQARPEHWPPVPTSLEELERLANPDRPLLQDRSTTVRTI